MEIVSLFSQITYLAEQIGEMGFLALISRKNTDKVKKFTKILLGFVTMMIGDRTYESLPYLRGIEREIDGATLVARAKDLDANLGEEDVQHFLSHQKDIPVDLRGEVDFVFPAWQCLIRGSPCFASVSWNGHCWIQDWRWVDCAAGGHDGRGRLLCRK